jgi:hypothetical protein
MARLTPEEIDRYRQAGWAAADPALPEMLLAPARVVARTLAKRNPWQELLSGIHNPFGRHAFPADAWKFLDIAESAAVLDAVEDVLGPDIVLWDSELYLDPAALPADESLWWPIEPLAGTIAILCMKTGKLLLIDVTRRSEVEPRLRAAEGPFYLLRYMPAASHFNREPRFLANRRAAEARALINYAKRPIWLVRGADRGDNDFAAGFFLPAAQWAGADAAADGWNRGRGLDMDEKES